MPRPTAAEALFPHLPHRQDNTKQQQRAQSLSAAMYPALAPQPKPTPPDRYREALLRNLKEANANLDARGRK